VRILLLFIEDTWKLRPFLTDRDRRSPPMMSAFDFSQTPRSPDPFPLRDDCKGPKFPEA
jgi:hypothetical protein